MLSRLLAVLTLLLLITLAGLVHGVWSSRWHTSEELQQALERVPRVPREFGSWRGKDQEVDPQMYLQAGAHAYWMRRYENTRTGTAVSVILMCGRFGPMSVHTPEVCYQGAGYELTGPATRVQVPLGDNNPATFWTGRFRKGQLDLVGQMRLYWSWNATGMWEAPDQPRLTFRGQPVLYKLYVLRELTTGAEAADTDPAVAFLGEFLPVAQKLLFPGLTP